MTNIIKIPVEKRYPREIRGKEIWAQAEPPESMVWEVCPYIRNNLEKCRHCPRYEHSEFAARYSDDGNDMTQRGCYILAAEACRIVFAAQNRQKKEMIDQPITNDMNQESLIEKLRKRAEIRRQISTRKSVQEGKPDRIADLLEEAANRIEELELKQ